MLGALRQSSRAAVSMVSKRSMSSGVSLAEEIKEMKKWKVITILAVPVCAVKAFVDLRHEEHHAAERPEYPYLRIRSKEFPWGDDGLFEVKH
mmetsp:Transcript_12374/g.24874  ORF Transcript_12374/g.24874 Transcript_12374/m.24874 type:complete len:92 (-) Transcript_12374:160-435(-)